MNLKAISVQQERMLRMRCSGRDVRFIAAAERVTYAQVKGMLVRAYRKLDARRPGEDASIARVCYMLGVIDERKRHSSPAQIPLDTT